MNEFLITLEDRPGSLAECCVALGDAGINIVAGAGIASASAAAAAAAALVTEDSVGTAAVLDEIGIVYTMRALETVVLQHIPGALGRFTRGLAENGINLGSIYIMKTDAEGVLIGYSTSTN